MAGYSFAFLYYFCAAGEVAAHYVQRDVRGRCGLGQEGRGSLRIVARGLEEGPLEARKDDVRHQQLVIRAFAACALQVSPSMLSASFGGQEAAGSGCGALPMRPLAAAPRVLPAVRYVSMG